MVSLEKKKLCWNCDGGVLRSASNCPYCGVYLHPEKEEDLDTMAQEPISSPYRFKDIPQESSHIPQPPYAKANSEIKEEVVEEDSADISSRGDWKEVVIPLALLLSGSIFFLFSVLMLLFSQNGTFQLQWNAEYWYLYLLVSLPLIYLGWHTLERIKDKE